MTEHILPAQIQIRRLGYAVAAIYVVVFGCLMSLRADAAPPCPPPQVDAEGGSVVRTSASCPGSPTGNSETQNYRDPVANVTLLGGRVVVSAASDSQLTSALGAARCGQTIQLAPGGYSGTFTLNEVCPANNPVIIKGAAGFASVVNGTFNLDGARNILTDVFLSGSNAGVYLLGTNNKVIGNKITGWGNGSQCIKNAVVAAKHSSLAEIAYNDIYSPGVWGTSCDGTQMRMGIRTEDDNEEDFHYNGWIHHNYIHDFPQKPVPSSYASGQNDAIEIGQTQGGRMPLVNSGWYIEYNRIENHAQGHGTVDLKVGGVVYRHNTFNNVPGRVDSRGSTLYGSIIESNYHRASGGSVIHGKDHKVVCNDFSSAIVLKAGDVACDAVDPGRNMHAHACNVLLSGNKSSLNVGKVDSKAETLAARNTTIRAHSGGITIGLQIGLLDQRSLEPTYQCAAASETTANMVGPKALSSALSAYKAARGL